MNGGICLSNTSTFLPELVVPRDMHANAHVNGEQAYRLLAAEMYTKGWDYPLHLGVTEAGEGEDGRMKSAIGTSMDVIRGCARL